MNKADGKGQRLKLIFKIMCSNFYFNLVLFHIPSGLYIAGWWPLGFEEPMTGIDSKWGVKTPS